MVWVGGGGEGAAAVGVVGFSSLSWRRGSPGGAETLRFRSCCSSTRCRPCRGAEADPHGPVILTVTRRFYGGGNGEGSCCCFSAFFALRPAGRRVPRGSPRWPTVVGCRGLGGDKDAGSRSFFKN